MKRHRNFQRKRFRIWTKILADWRIRRKKNGTDRRIHIPLILESYANPRRILEFSQPSFCLDEDTQTRKKSSIDLRQPHKNDNFE